MGKSRPINTLDIPTETLWLEGNPYKVRVVEGKLQYHDGLNRPGNRWVKAPRWAQRYYDQTRAELASDMCKSCGGDIRMIVMTGTGFCSINCQDEYDDTHRASGVKSGRS